MISDSELHELEAAVVQAIATGDARHLRLLGHGEISVVIGWPGPSPEFAVKRLPPFPSAAVFDDYADVVRRYVAGLESAGVRVLDTEVRRITRSDGSVVGFHIQPAVPGGSLGHEQLAGADPAAGHPIVPAVVEAVQRGANLDHGIDAQMANWAWLDGEPFQLDLTTPFVLGPDGRPAIPLAPFLASLPAAVRPVVRGQMTQLIRRWMSPRGALVDLVANLYKTRLDDWVDPMLREVNRVVSPPVTAVEARGVHRGDRRLWPVLFRLQKTQRWWCHRVRRRPYGFLLPETTTYE